ncbi:hypothetical protein IV203_003605 [Nitzschia inconspicua]|uniref:Uncharacterized protein n=1 Tax=Nitzschia inconspicua TaxID=303405 RepID=A0A9K3L2W7_9STRA|nr:hypothetical protein IV203_003605 [Nitzschia inconspicua]
MAQDEEDPFSVVKPQANNVKMSHYIKKHKQRREIEESSHGTNSTRSTTISNRTDDHSHPTSSNKSASSTNSGMLSGSTSDGSFANFGEEHHIDATAEDIAFGSDFGNGLEFVASGGETASARSRKIRGSRNDTSRKPKSGKHLSSTSSSEDGFFSSDPFAIFEEDAPVNFGDGDFGEKLFGDDLFGDFEIDNDKRGDFQDNPRSNSHPESRRKERVPRRHHSSDGFDLAGMASVKSPGKPQSRRKMMADPAVPSKELERSGPPMRARSGRNRRASLDLSAHLKPSRPDDEQSLFSAQTEPADLTKHSRRNRRSSLGCTYSDGSLPGISSHSLALHPPPAPSDAPLQRGIPQRHKSSMGTAMDPRLGERRMRSRRVISDGTSSNVKDLFDGSTHKASVLPEDRSTSSHDNTKNKKWTNDRSRNQEMIMNMYKDGAVSKKNDQKHFGSSSDLGHDLEVLGIHEEDLFPSTTGDFSGGGEKKRRSALSKLKNIAKKKDLHAPSGEEDVADARNLAGRSRGTLLERVGAVDETSERSSATLRTGGSNYSDRILMSSNRK